jgi:hypothetical protein
MTIPEFKDAFDERIIMLNDECQRIAKILFCGQEKDDEKHPMELFDEYAKYMKDRIEYLMKTERVVEAIKGFCCLPEPKDERDCGEDVVAPMAFELVIKMRGCLSLIIESLKNVQEALLGQDHAISEPPQPKSSAALDKHEDLLEDMLFMVSVARYFADNILEYIGAEGSEE